MANPPLLTRCLVRLPGPASTLRSVCDRQSVVRPSPDRPPPAHTSLAAARPARMAPAAGASSAEQAVLGSSEPLPADTPLVRGYVFPSRGDAPGGVPPAVDYGALLEAMATTGFQATHFGAAVAELNRMLAWRLSDEPVPADASPEDADPAYRANTRCKARALLPRCAAGAMPRSGR